MPELINHILSGGEIGGSNVNDVSTRFNGDRHGTDGGNGGVEGIEPSPIIKPVRLPTVTHGHCRRCFTLSDLGNGLCPQCWDKGRR